MLAACARRNSRQLGPPRRGAGFRVRSGEQPANACRRHPQTELGQLTTDPPVAPARILPGEPQHQLPHLSRQLRPSTLAGRLPPFPANERLMPAQKRPRSHQKAHPARSAGDGRLRLPTGPGQACRASAARPAGAGSRARGAAPAARCPSRGGRGGYEQARRAEPARRGRGTRRPCRRSSRPARQREATPILAPFRSVLRRCARARLPRRRRTFRGHWTGARRSRHAPAARSDRPPD